MPRLFHGSWSTFMPMSFSSWFADLLSSSNPSLKSNNCKNNSRFSTDLILPPEVLHFHQIIFRNSQIKRKEKELKITAFCGNSTASGDDTHKSDYLCQCLTGQCPDDSYTVTCISSQFFLLFQIVFAVLHRLSSSA